MATDLLSTNVSERRQLQPADVIVIGGSCRDADDVQHVAAATRDALTSVRALLVHPDTIVAGADGSPAVALLPYRLAAPQRLPLVATAGRDLFTPIADIVERTGARACAVIGAAPESIAPSMFRALVPPVVEEGLDLVLPCYARHRLDGLINSAIVTPLTGALYGRRVDGQMGVDFGFSARFVTAIAADDLASRERPLWLMSEALRRDMQIGQAHIAAAPAPAESGQDLSTALAQVLGSLFEDMERHATIWQRTRTAQPVPTFGQPDPIVEEHRLVDHGAMIESFQLGFRNLQDVWALVLPPATLIELGRLARTRPEQFRIGPALWARLVFDFALGHRLRMISRDHLLRAFTPVYLAWVASYVLEVGGSDRAAVAATLQRTRQAFESEKPYLLARWRWPDRFHP
jgi:hypothetical protein